LQLVAKVSRRIVLPIEPTDYAQQLQDRQRFRQWVDKMHTQYPELFPDSFAEGYYLHDLCHSSKMPEVPIRRIWLLHAGEVYRIVPSFVLLSGSPYGSPFHKLNEQRYRSCWLEEPAGSHFMPTSVFPPNPLEPETFHMRLQRHLLRIARDTQAHFPALSSYCAHHRRTVIGKGATSPSLVGTPTWRVSRVEMLNAFFPRILKHLVAFRMGVAEGCVGLDRLCLQTMPPLQHRLVAQVQFTCQLRVELPL
jgi:hypothetical protein